ncbi:MAG: hypothetical protein V1670_06395 [Candidatus Omnitrophota bacterium]
MKRKKGKTRLTLSRIISLPIAYFIIPWIVALACGIACKKIKIASRLLLAMVITKPTYLLLPR